jgi:hypothetical protein
MITTNLESSQLVGQHIVDTFDLPRDNAIEYMTEIVLEADNMDELESALRNDLGIDLNEINMTINNNEAETSP